MSSYIIFQSYIQTYENVKKNLQATLVLPDLQVILSLDEKALLKAIHSFFLTPGTIECLLDACPCSKCWGVLAHLLGRNLIAA